MPGTHKLGAGVEEAYQSARHIRDLEKKRGQGFSAGRLLMTLGHKYGHSLEDARAAVLRLRTEERSQVKADMRPGFGVNPVECSASQLLARLTDLTAAVELMARQTQVSRVAEKGTQDITRLAKLHGYDVRTTQNRAFYTTDFVKEDHTLHMMGWHGTGRFVGGEKAILELYDSRYGDKPVVTIGVLNEENVTPDNEKHVIQKIMDYIKKQG